MSTNRGVVKAIVDDVKSRHSARKMACADELLGILKAWKQTTEFADAEDWIFVSTVKLGRMPLGYTSVWNMLTKTCTRLGIAHVSSHRFRHTYRSWLDVLGSPIGLQQRMMRHSSITTTANYGDTVPSDLRQAHEKVAQRAVRHGRLYNSLKHWGGRRELNTPQNLNTTTCRASGRSKNAAKHCRNR